MAIVSTSPSNATAEESSCHTSDTFMIKCRWSTQITFLQQYLDEQNIVHGRCFWFRSGFTWTVKRDLEFCEFPNAHFRYRRAGAAHPTSRVVDLMARQLYSYGLFHSRRQLSELSIEKKWKNGTIKNRKTKIWIKSAENIVFVLDYLKRTCIFFLKKKKILHTKDWFKFCCYSNPFLSSINS